MKFLRYNENSGEYSSVGEYLAYEIKENWSTLEASNITKGLGIRHLIKQELRGYKLSEDKFTEELETALGCLKEMDDMGELK